MKEHTKCLQCFSTFSNLLILKRKLGHFFIGLLDLHSSPHFCFQFLIYNLKLSTLIHFQEAVWYIMFFSGLFTHIQ